MAFKVRKTAYRAWPVTVRLQSCDDAGSVSTLEQMFVAHFKAFSEADHAAVVKELEARYPKPAESAPVEPKAAESAPVNLPETLRRNAEYFVRLIEGWGPEVTDEAGIPLPYSAEALIELVTGPDGLAISAALAQAVGELRFGVAPAKNSNASLAPGDSSGGPSEATTNLPAT